MGKAPGNSIDAGGGCLGSSMMDGVIGFLAWSGIVHSQYQLDYEAVCWSLRRCRMMDGMALANAFKLSAAYIDTVQNPTPQHTGAMTT